MTDYNEIMEYDLVIVGAGPAGLATAIAFRQLCQKFNKDYSVCILEKGSEVGANIISGAVFQVEVLNQLLPNWENNSELAKLPLYTKVKHDKFYFLTKNFAIPLPIPKIMNNKNNYIISLSNLCKFLGQYAESLNIDIFPGTPASKLLINNDNKVYGIQTREFGIKRDGTYSEQHQLGINIHARELVLAEGCRGYLTEQVIKKFGLINSCYNQTYALGLKELWQLDKKNYQDGLVMHTMGWPLKNKAYGGGFIYHFSDNNNYLMSIGLVIGLDYQNPYLNPFREFQEYKLHPKFRNFFNNATRIGYGARALTEGGAQSIPKLTFPGGLIVGCGAGFMNVPKIKGSHNAIRSGIIAANNIFNYFNKANTDNLKNFNTAIKTSKIYQELYKVRNIRPSFKHGLYSGMLYSVMDLYLFRGREPWTFKPNLDYKSLKPANACKKINYTMPDGKITFDLPSSVYLTNTDHNEDQICHLKVLNKKLILAVNYKIYGGPEQYYCPAGVYEYINKKLQINAQNCIHCKTCDIKDPEQNIKWMPPEGGGGPNYQDM